MKPRLLDGFCGAGGATRGYQQAGFHVTGVDNRPQPHYCGDAFIQGDALEYIAAHGHEYDAIHASPPCQFYTRLRHLPWLKDRVYWRSIPPTRAVLVASGRPWVMENVEDAWTDMPDSIILCGQMFGLPLFRHRRFAAASLLLQPPHQKHSGVITPGRASLAQRHHGMKGINNWDGAGGLQRGLQRHQTAMGIDWMNGDELAQAIPPVMTEFIGRQLLAYCQSLSESR